MTRLAGIDLPKKKNIVIALTYIFGIGIVKSKEILEKASIDENTKTKDISIPPTA